ncbi:hypothetical protein NEOKW01_0235 [Nematocida sp. AWRm80]|nr:hypothetical protein NEOKW01_0235 [Nematocida sp. AWRm80]
MHCLYSIGVLLLSILYCSVGECTQSIKVDSTLAHKGTTKTAKYNISEIPEYTTKDLYSEVPMLLFIYYDGEDKGKCMACQEYYQWLLSLNGKISSFTIKRLNFNSNPSLVLRFKTVQFPTFFLQYKQRFKNISAVDFYGLGIMYTNDRYINDIDAIIKNPRVFDKIDTLEGFKSPSSKWSLVYSKVLSLMLMVTYIHDIFSVIVPIWALLMGILFLLGITRMLKRNLPLGLAPEKDKKTKTE